MVSTSLDLHISCPLLAEMDASLCYMFLLQLLGSEVILEDLGGNTTSMATI